MEKIDYLPLGSVVFVRNGIKELMIIARCLGAKINDEVQMFDYGACTYPEGLLGDQIMYFNHEDIDKVIFSGYSNEMDSRMVATLNDFMEKTDIKRGNPYDLNIQNMNLKAKI